MNVCKNRHIMMFLSADFDGVGGEFEVPADGFVWGGDHGAQGETLCV